MTYTLILIAFLLTAIASVCQAIKFIATTNRKNTLISRTMMAVQCNKREIPKRLLYYASEGLLDDSRKSKVNAIMRVRESLVTDNKRQLERKLESISLRRHLSERWLKSKEQDTTKLTSYKANSRNRECITDVREIIKTITNKFDRGVDNDDKRIG